MTTTRQIFIDRLTELEFQYDVTLRDDYSGRGMYGNRCMAISGDAEEVQLAVLHAVAAAGSYAEVVPSELARLAQWHTDQLGLGIIYYWPELSTD